MSLKRNIVIGTVAVVGFIAASTVTMLLTTALSALIPVKQVDRPGELEKSLEQKLTEQSATKTKSEKSESQSETPEAKAEEPVTAAPSAPAEATPPPPQPVAPPPQPRFTTGPGNFDAPSYYTPAPQTGPGNM